MTRLNCLKYIFKKEIVWGVLFLFLSSCKNLFQFHPAEVRLEEHEQNLNAKNLQRLAATRQQDTFKFILIGDSQRFYNEVNAFVEHVNERNDVAFILLAGDITDFGWTKEYKWIHRSLSKLSVPYVAVIGNHDLLANGKQVYQKMFGPEDFSFAVNGCKFICLNTNSREFGFNGKVPNLSWLAHQLADVNSYKQVFVIGHVPPFSADFDKKLEQSYAALLASKENVHLSLHGHEHNFSRSIPYRDGVEYLVSGSLDKRSYTLISIWNDQYKIDQIPY